MDKNCCTKTIIISAVISIVIAVIASIVTSKRLENIYHNTNEIY